MRMRLRAPDEPEAESSYDLDGDNDSAPSTPERSHQLQPLDVGSPEYIEERLENLKRRPKWVDFLDQYVQDHPDSDSENGDFEDVVMVDTPGFIRSTLWSLLVVALAPLLILCAPCLRHKSYGFWPLECRSMKELFGCALTNVIFIIFGLVLLYWTICRDLPDVFNVSNTLVKLNVQIDEMQRAAETCHAALLQWERTVAQELCMPVGIDAALLLLNTWLLLHYHRRWAKYFMVLMAVMFVVDVPTQLYDATFPAPEIHKVDPTFAMVDEELLVALDGKNLKPGGSVTWVAYWGCATTSNVDACDKQFVSTFEAGNVAVTFKSLDHFIPCYRDPPNPLKAQDYLCFEDVRIRVKDKQSIPGWSRSTPQTSASQAAKDESSLSDKWQAKLEASPFKSGKRMDRDAIQPMHRMIDSAEPIEVDELDASATMGSFSESSSTAHGGEVRLKEVDEGESKTTTKVDVGNEKVEEVEVTSDAEVKKLHIDIKLEIAPQSEVAMSLAESSEEPEAVTDLQQVSSETQVEVEVVKPKNQVASAPAGKVEGPGFTDDSIDVESDALLNDEITMVEDEIELSTMTVVQGKEPMQVVRSNQDGRAIEAELKSETERSTYETQSGKMSTSGTIGQDDELDVSASKQEISTPVQDIQLGPRDTTIDDTHSKKRKNVNRKSSRQPKKAAQPGIHH
ncbi:hypothetical protein F444_22206 [Phytophthora nicotianae P1976]|uniref:Uncharacterized protein n=1 Tax=Phytophthora nicotianae P1976 TaxID=1317066 RepID=A0A080YYI5_PHYNI|nr:hypothetical protein F444_22206 [Phytophthora nicotianae P1976]